MNELPVEPMVSNVFWAWIVPALLFGFSCVATWLLYRHFMHDGDEDSIIDDEVSAAGPSASSSIRKAP